MLLFDENYGNQAGLHSQGSSENHEQEGYLEMHETAGTQDIPWILQSQAKNGGLGLAI